MSMLGCMTARRGDPTPEVAADGAADVAGRLAAALERIAHARRALMQDIATRTGLSALQAEILRHVHASGPTSGSALAQEFGVTTPTISDAIAALRHKGFVEQRPGVDARTRSAHLTPSGLQVATRIDARSGPLPAGVRRGRTGRADRSARRDPRPVGRGCPVGRPLVRHVPPPPCGPDTVGALRPPRGRAHSGDVAGRLPRSRRRLASRPGYTARSRPGAPSPDPRAATPHRPPR
jgi:DNA-binding MarR family transcriptional regulator